MGNGTHQAEKIRVAVVDDEALGRQKVRLMIADDPEAEVVGEASDGKEAVALIREARPDVVFLDIQMPGMDGFAVLREFDPEELPLIVFVTAYDQHAVEAFRVHALDYLLKPFDRQRFAEALHRVKEQVRQRREEKQGDRLASMLRTIDAEQQPLDRLMLKSNGRIVFLRSEEIDWVEAQGDYVCLHVGGKKHLLRDKISQMEQHLPYRHFIRIHRSTIVNIDRIREMQPLFYGEYAVVLNDGTKLTMSRSFREKVFQRLAPNA